MDQNKNSSETKHPSFIGTEEEFLATFGQPMTEEREAIATDAVRQFMFPTLNSLYPRRLTIEEMAQMERLTADLDAQLAELLKDRPRRYVPKAERDG